MQNPPYSITHDANKPPYPFPEDENLSQKPRKMSCQLINMTAYKSLFIYSQICNCIRLLTVLYRVHIVNAISRSKCKTKNSLQFYALNNYKLFSIIPIPLKS